MPAARPVIVVLVPEPVVVMFTGDLVSVQVPDEGSPLRGTLPVATVQDGWTIAPMTGTDGVSGWLFRIAAEEAEDVQPDEFVTVKV